MLTNESSSSINLKNEEARQHFDNDKIIGSMYSPVIAYTSVKDHNLCACHIFWLSYLVSQDGFYKNISTEQLRYIQILDKYIRFDPHVICVCALMTPPV